MKKSYLILVALSFLSVYSLNAQALPQGLEPVVIAYTMRGPLPDPMCVTHFNYAFGHVNNTFTGIPPHQLVLGILFYGKGSANIRFWQVRNQTEFREQWDDVAKVPYLTNAEGEFMYTYENPRSIVLKCDFLKERGLRDAMYWEYSQDDYLGTMQKTVYEGVMK